jgi:phosphate transport system permease protein
VEQVQRNERLTDQKVLDANLIDALKGFQDHRKSLMDWFMPKLLFLCAMISIGTSIGIVWTLFGETLSFFKEVTLFEFFTGTKWAPLIEPKAYGVLPLLMGTFQVTIIACLFAFPIGIAAAIYLSEYANATVRKVVKPVLEVLAGIPTIVLGYFALFFVTPQIQKIFDETGIFNALSAGICVGIMIVPMICSLSEDAMSAVPRKLREGAFALGATRFEAATQVVFPAALSGIIASFVLAFSRAVGETMIVTVAAGATPTIEVNPLDSIQTMTAFIVQVIMGDAPHGSTEYQTVYAVGMTLFVITLVLNVIALLVARKYREEY